MWGLTKMERENHLHWPAAHVAFAAAQDIFVYLGCTSTFLGHFEFFIHHHDFLLRAVLSSPYLCLWLPWHRCRSLHLALFNFLIFTGSHLLCQNSSGRDPIPPECQLNHSAVVYVYAYRKTDNYSSSHSTDFPRVKLRAYLPSSCVTGTQTKE